MDKFPEAFERFEKDVDITTIESFQQLLIEFKIWGDKKAPLTKLQRKALAIEGEKEGIKPRMRVRRDTTKGFTLQLKNVLTGRWVKEEEEEED